MSDRSCDFRPTSQRVGASLYMPGRSSLVPLFAISAAMLAWGVAPADMTGRVGSAMKDNGLAHADVERMERGYYEGLIDSGRRVDHQEHAAHPDAPFDAGVLASPVADLREFVLKPNLRTTHRGQPWSTNELGMRDRSYEITKPPNTLRIAIVGDSIGAGWGVDDESGFDPVLERSLDTRSRAAGGPAVEVLNFSVPGHAPGQRWEDFAKVGWRMSPDLVIYEATPADTGWDERRLRGLLAKGVGWNASQYQQVLADLHVPRGRGFDDYKRVLRPHRQEVMAAVYRTVARECRSRGVPCVWLLVPRIGRPATDVEHHALLETAQKSGFTAILDISDVFDGLDHRSLTISANDYHPNATGHARIAERLEAMLIARADLFAPVGPRGDTGEQGGGP
jgi:lysophospholipase L1-like esterase